MCESDASNAQSFHSWLRGHFRLDSDDLAEISSLIPPGLPCDVDMPDVLAVLVDEDEATSLQQPAAPAQQPDLDAFTMASWPVQQQAGGAAAPSQPGSPCLPAADPAPLHAAYQYQEIAGMGKMHAQQLHLLQQRQQGLVQQEQQGLQQQQQQQQNQQLVEQQQLLLPQQNQQQMPLLHPHGMQQHQQLLYSMQQQELMLQLQPHGMHHQQQQQYNHGLNDKRYTSPFTCPLPAAAPAANTAVPLYSTQMGASPAAAHNYQLPAIFLKAEGAADSSAAAAPVPTSPSVLPARPAKPRKASSKSSMSSASGQGSQPGDGNPPAAAATAAAGGGGRAAAAGAAAAAAANGAAAGVAKARRRRAPSDAQREAHRRFRQRRKEMMSSLEQELASKRAQLQALSLEHMALTAKARALDQLVASAGDDVELLQQLEQISLQQQPGDEGEGTQQLQLQDAGQQQQATQQQLLDSCCKLLPPLQAATADAFADPCMGLTLTQQQARPDDQAGLSGLQVQEYGKPVHRSSSRQSVGSSGAGQAGSIEHLEAAMHQVLAVTYNPVQLMPTSDRLRMQGALPKLQALVKSLVSEVMQLVLQVGQETGRQAPWPSQHQLMQQQSLHDAAATAAGAATAVGEGALASITSAACAAGEPPANASPAFVRLQFVQSQVRAEFRKFAMTNRLSFYHLHTLNVETGVCGVRPPAEHWQKVSQLLKDRLSPQALADLCVARQLYSSTVMRIKQQRQLLVLQLQQLLDRYTSMGAYKRDSVVSDLRGPHCEGTSLLDAIDSNMRKEYTLEGVYQWMFHKLIPPMLSAEILVHSYPYIPDSHAILAELTKEPQQVPALSAVQELQLQQLNALEQQAQLQGGMA